VAKPEYLNVDHDLNALKKVAGEFARILIPKENEKYSPTEKGYVYFQDFISGSLYDASLIVVGNRCFGLRRYCRNEDFRASGSGLFC
jgi:hypothetical protein